MSPHARADERREQYLYFGNDANRYTPVAGVIPQLSRLARVAYERRGGLMVQKIHKTPTRTGFMVHKTPTMAAGVQGISSRPP